MTTIGELLAGGEVGGRTVQMVESGEVECATYPIPDPPAGAVLVRTVRSAISPGTEMTFYGKAATNVYLSKRWNPELRLFEPGSASLSYPLTFGYRAAGEVVASRSPEVEVGTRIFGTWRHAEYTVLSAERALGQRLAAGLTWDDGVDIGQMGPICLNAVAFAEGLHVGRPAVVFGAGPVGLITAQVARATGAASVHVVDRNPARLANAAELGFEKVQAAAGVGVAVQLKQRFGASGIPVIWECSGAVAGLAEAIRTVAPLGTVVCVGFYQRGASELLLGEEFHHNAVRLVSAQIGNVHPGDSITTLRARTAEMVLAGRLRLGELPRTTLPVERVADGFRALSQPGSVLQVVLSY